MTHDFDELVQAPWAPATPMMESARLQDLHSLPLSALVRSRALENIVLAAAAALDAPVAAVSLVDREREHFVTLTGEVRGTGLRAESFCAHTILENGVFVIRDTWADERFARHPLAQEANVRFYAGAAIRGPMGHPIGALCVRDVAPGDPTPAQLKTLESLATVASDAIRAELATAALSQRTADLAQAQEQLQLLLGSEIDAKYGVDLDGACTCCNEAFLRMFGFDHPGEVLGRSMRSLIQPPAAEDAPADTACPEAGAMAKGVEVWASDEPLRRRDGSMFLAGRRAQPVVRGGEIVGALVNVVDVDSRRLAEPKLRREALPATAEEAIFDVSFDGAITGWSRGAEALFGRLAEDAVGTSLFGLLSSDDREQARQSLRTACLDGSVLHISVRGVGRHSETIAIFLTFAPTQGLSEEAARCAVIARRRDEPHPECGETMQSQRVGKGES